MHCGSIGARFPVHVTALHATALHLLGSLLHPPADREATEAASVLYNSLMSSHVETDAAGAQFVQLDGGTKWPQLGKARLFVRSFYDDCFEGPLASLDPSCTSPHRKFVVVGNSGSEWERGTYQGGGGQFVTSVFRRQRAARVRATVIKVCFLATCPHFLQSASQRMGSTSCGAQHRRGARSHTPA